MVPGRAALLASLLCLGCQEPLVGECLGRPGSLCITVRNAESFPAGLRAVLDVRVSGCEAVAPFPCQAGAPVAAVAGCKLSCQDVAVPARFTGAEGRFTAEIDLSSAPGAGSASVRLYDGADPEGCLGQAAAPWVQAPAAVVLDPHAGACPVRPKRCVDHVGCGGPSAAQFCDRGVCVDPPADACPPGMVLIPAGALTLGSESGAPWEQPCVRDGKPLRHRITRPFCLDRAEATVAQLRDCAGCPKPDMMDSGCTYRQVGNDHLAVNCLTYNQAAAYCAARAWKGKRGRLPWEAEWEWAAGRDPKRRYPWGDAVPANICDYANATYLNEGAPRTCERAAPPVRAPGQTPAGDSPTEIWPAQPVHDLAGNLAEWVADLTPAMTWHSYCDLKDLDAPFNTVGGANILRGGSWADQAPSLRTFSRVQFPRDPDILLLRQVGVRCVIDPVLPPP